MALPPGSSSPDDYGALASCCREILERYPNTLQAERAAKLLSKVTRDYLEQAEKSRGLESPLLPVLPENQHWLCWVCYQFLYVAVAEEVFFRGYLLSNILRLTSAIKCRLRLRNWVSIVLSAACFAAAHIIIQGQIIAVLTFLPGLVLAYLFVRTKSLLAPILFHGLGLGNGGSSVLPLYIEAMHV